MEYVKKTVSQKKYQNVHILTQFFKDHLVVIFKTYLYVLIS